jgi:hypothetical protein
MVKKLVIDAKSVSCVDCGQAFSWWQMQFDHLRDKEFNMSRIWTLSSIKRARAEISKCDVVCANCHADRTYKREHGLPLKQGRTDSNRSYLGQSQAS